MMASILKRLDALALLLIVHMTTVVLCIDYEFVLDDEKIFSLCSTNLTKGIHSLFDMSKMSLTYTGDTVHVEGSTKVVWKNVAPTDRIAAHGAFFKLQVGSWQPTPFSMQRPDLCSVIWKSDELWYKTFTNHIHTEDRSCVNKLGQIYRYHPFDVRLRLNNISGADHSGRYKIQIYIEAYDKMNRMRPNVICIAILGDLIRV